MDRTLIEKLARGFLEHITDGEEVDQDRLEQLVSGALSKLQARSTAVKISIGRALDEETGKVGGARITIVFGDDITGEQMDKLEKELKEPLTHAIARALKDEESDGYEVHEITDLVEQPDKTH